MTREEVLAMKPGRELDALVAEKVMGWKNFSPIDPQYDHAVGVNGYRRNFARRPNKERDEPIPLYSSDMSAAWEVVEKMRPTHVYELADFGRNKYKNCPHYAAFHPIDKPRDYERQVHAKSLPEAICKASLLAVMDL